MQLSEPTSWVQSPGWFSGGEDVQSGFGEKTRSAKYDKLGVLQISGVNLSRSEEQRHREMFSQGGRNCRKRISEAAPLERREGPSPWGRW